MVILLRYAFILGMLALWVWCSFDVIRSDGERVHYLHKLVWLVFVVVFSPLGALAWLILGRPEPIGSRLIPPPQPSAPAPDDSPEFLRRVDEEIRRRRRAEQLRGERPQASPEIPAERVDEELRRLEEQFRDHPNPDEPPAGG
jgi:hypothetical protein